MPPAVAVSLPLTGLFVVRTPADQPIDWNIDADFTDTNVNADINNFGTTAGLDGTGTILQGYDDWANLQYNFRAAADFADGVHVSAVQVEEITLDQALTLSPDSDGDGVLDLLDNCPFTANPDQQDRDGNGVGDVCETQDITASLRIVRSGFRQTPKPSGL
jgi:hypothetical protein